MARYICEYIDRGGQRRSEIVDCPQRDEALALVRRKANTVLQVRRRNLLDQLRQIAAFGPGRHALSTSQLQSFAYILGEYLKAGISIQEALNLTGLADPRITHLAAAVRTNLASGLAVDEALQASGFGFPSSFVALIKAGAESGNIHSVMISEADRLQIFQGIRRDLLTSLVYPFALIVMCILVIGFMLIHIVPQVRASVTEEALSNAPAVALMIFAVSDAINGLKLEELFFGAAASFAAITAVLAWSVAWRRTIILRLPEMGAIVTSLSAASFCYALGTMLRASVRTELAWRLAAAGVSQPHIRSQLEAGGIKIVQGASISVAAAETKVLPQDVMSVLALGERTGTLPTLLLEVARLHSAKAISRLKTLAGIAAPAVILLAGIIVGGFAVAMMSTILSVNQTYMG